MDILTAFDKKPSPTVECKSKTKTKQSLKKECDINYIVSRFAKTGMLENVSQRKPVYTGDAIYPCDYQSALDMVDRAEETYESLPKKVRDLYPDFPSFVEALDTLTASELKNLGLLNDPNFKKEEKEQVKPVPGVETK